ncbi:MAG: hemolysin family protein [Chitinophagales bacterium]|nr:hemolysin family protein [Chitinophagales bacterium]MCZ2393939.1 hemolysin family protein [Chitinophagales bacterium]
MEILIIIILILVNGLFSMSEIALVSSKKYKLEMLAKKGNSNAEKALQLATNPNTFLSTVQIGITLIGILTGIYSGDSLTQPLQNWLSTFSTIVPYAHPLAVALIVVIITFFSIVFGELIPKRIAMMFPESIASVVATPMKILSTIARPFIWLLTATNEFVLAVFGLDNQQSEHISEEEIKAIIQESTTAGEIQEIEQDIVERVFSMGDRKVDEIMTHRSDILWVDIQDSMEEIKEKIKDELHSVYLVCDKQIDDWKGLVFVKELFPVQFENATFKVEDFIRKPIIFPENTPVYKVLEKFKENRFHYGIVVNEYGALEGLVAMDDVLDALLGDMTEYNQDEFQIVERNENSWLIDAQIPYYVFCEYFEIDEDAYEGNFNTLGGFVLQELGHIPSAGEKFNWENYEFEIVDMDGVRIDKIMVTRS